MSLRDFFERLYEDMTLVCRLTECPFNRYLTDAPDGSFVLLDEHGSLEDGLPVCSARIEEWDASRVPDRCPIRTGAITPWNRKGENPIYSLLGKK